MRKKGLNVLEHTLGSWVDYRRTEAPRRAHDITLLNVLK